LIITLTIDEQLAQRASLAAQQMGMTLNQALSDYLEQLADGSRRS
jgi:antitoxin component of RelBE/YafQ-DinJ toxin-antitoxin module